MNNLPEGTSYKDFLNPESVTVCTGCKLEASSRMQSRATSSQFVRNGFFTPDSKHPGVFNRIVTLRDSFKPAQK